MKAMVQFVSKNGPEIVIRESDDEDELREWLFELSRHNDPFLADIENSNRFLMFSNMTEECIQALCKYIGYTGYKNA